MAHIHQGLLDAIHEFTEGYGRDERYKSVLEGLKGAVSGINELGPNADGAPTPGALAAKLAADPAAAAPVKEAPPAPAAGEAPKSFADATALAKERMAAA
jgi:hypothetical protein